MSDSNLNTTLFLSGMGKDISLPLIIDILNSQLNEKDCIESAIHYKKNGTAYLKIDTKENYDHLLKYFEEEQLICKNTGKKCVIIPSRKPIRDSGLAQLKNKEGVSVWFKNPILYNVERLVESAEKMDRKLRITFGRIRGLLAEKGNIMGCRLKEIYDSQYKESLSFESFGYPRLFPFLQDGESLHYFHLNYSPGQDVQICLRKEDSNYNVSSSGHLKRTLENMSSELNEDKELLTKRTNFKVTPPWRK